MKKCVLTVITLLFFCITPFNAFGGDFDGTRDLLCACMRVIECSPDGDCNEAMVEDVGIPQFLQINFEKKIITAPQWGENHVPSKIKNLERIDGKLILQGAEDGLIEVQDGAAWSIAISEETGKMVLTESTDRMGFIIFGACTPF